MENSEDNSLNKKKREELKYRLRIVKGVLHQKGISLKGKPIEKNVCCICGKSVESHTNVRTQARLIEDGGSKKTFCHGCYKYADVFV